MIIIEAVFMGFIATFFMDVLAGILARNNLIFPFISQEAIGRWFLCIFKGKGILASKSPNRSQVIRTNLINHTNFGIGLMAWMVAFHRFFI